MYTIDASVWINASGKKEPGYRDSQRLLHALAFNAVAMVLPTLLLAEIAGSLSRRGTPLKRINTTIERLITPPNFVFVPLDMTLASKAVDISIKYKLKGPDAVYAAVAQQHNCTLITLDQEQLTRLTGVLPTLTPAQALANLPPAS